MKDQNFTQYDVIILRGVSGSGKSTITKRSEYEGFEVVSADDFFTDENGVYNFNPKELGEAHQCCLRHFLDLIEDGFPIIVDNTNCSVAEIAPYYALAEMFDRKVVIVEIDIDPNVAAARGTHGVPPQKVLRQAEVMKENTKMIPPWWNRVVVRGQ